MYLNLLKNIYIPNILEILVLQVDAISETYW